MTKLLMFDSMCYVNGASRPLDERAPL
uniref:Uncharacterized protein n=1 Tax=Rhizophora mucronata TaxID=61149 RepID=A0A2P2QM42_RHIMU